MGTRCTITIEGMDCCKIYKHWDGYPEYMLKRLEKFNQRFTKVRGDDPNQKFAQLLMQASVYFSDLVEYDLLDNGNSESPWDGTGWEIIPSGKNWVGIDYEYVLHPDGTVSV